MKKILAVIIAIVLCLMSGSFAIAEKKSTAKVLINGKSKCVIGNVNESFVVTISGHIYNTIYTSVLVEPDVYKDMTVYFECDYDEDKFGNLHSFDYFEVDFDSLKVSLIPQDKYYISIDDDPEQKNKYFGVSVYKMPEEGYDYLITFKAKLNPKVVNLKEFDDAEISLMFFEDGEEASVASVVVSEGRVKMHRLYNPNSGEHFYTGSTKEKDGLVKVGWKYEGIGWHAPKKSNTPVYRLYNKNAGDHHYTMSKKEKDWLVGLGWIYEGIGWYSDDNKQVPLYRQYNPNAVSGSHNYTISKIESDWLVSKGWKYEGIGWYGKK